MKHDMLIIAILIFVMTTNHHQLSESLAFTNSRTFIEFFKGHNYVRAGKNLAPLVWNPQLERHASLRAQQWLLDDCQLKDLDGTFEVEGETVGENLCWGFPFATATTAVRSWALQENYYSYNDNRCSQGQCNNYVQLVWNTTREVGCARVFCGQVVNMVCLYYPPAEIGQRRPY